MEYRQLNVYWIAFYTAFGSDCDHLFVCLEEFLKGTYTAGHHNKGVGRSSGQYRRLPIYAGNDSQILPSLALGASGVISVVSNLFPRETAALYRAFREGELVEARRIQLSLLPFIRAIFLETNPAPIKCALAMLELSSEELRLPLAPVREPTRSAILAALRPLLGGRALPG